MRRTVLVVFCLAAACGRGAPTETAQDIDALTRRVTSLERRMQQMENGERPKADAPREADAADRAQGAERGRALIEVSGDAVLVGLSRNKRHFPVPGPVPAGEFDIEASFTAGEPPAPAGKLTVPADGTVTLVCAAATKSCAVP